MHVRKISCKSLFKYFEAALWVPELISLLMYTCHLKPWCIQRNSDVNSKVSSLAAFISSGRH